MTDAYAPHSEKAAKRVRGKVEVREGRGVGRAGRGSLREENSPNVPKNAMSHSWEAR